jgi:hypothetical protein
MLKKTITFENFDGETVTEDFYFNLTKAELMELEVSEQGGFSEAMQDIIKAGNGKEIIAGFKRILLMSVGRRKGNSFIKNDEIREEFEGSPAFSELFMQLATDAQAGAEFVNAVIPKDLAQQVQGQLPLPTVETQTVELPQPEVPVSAENMENIQAALPPDFTKMSAEEFEAWKNANL